MAGYVEPDPALLRAFRAAVRAKFARDLEAEQAAAERLRRRTLADLQVGLADARRQGLCGAAWLFGSYAWGRPTERSDVDLLVAACRDPDLLAVIVGRATGTDVHIVQVEHAPESLRDRVAADGVPL